MIMSAALHFHPSLKPAGASLDELRRTCDFRSMGYHYPRSNPKLLHVFVPPHSEFYDQWGDNASKAEVEIAAGRVVPFRVTHPMLRVVYDKGSHQVWAYFPDGSRERLIDEADAWNGPICALAEAQRRLVRRGIIARIPAADRAGRRA